MDAPATRRERVIALCEEFAAFIEGTDPDVAEQYYRRLAQELRADPPWGERRRIYKAINRGAGSGAGGWGDFIVPAPDGSPDFPATDGFQHCRYALLRATRTI